MHLKQTLLTLATALVLCAMGRADTIFGKVVNPSGVPVAGVRVTIGATRVDTNAQGIFAVVVPTGTYDVVIEPGTNTLVPVEIRGVRVVVSKDMGTIQLQAGFRLTGRAVTAASAPVVGADLNVYDAAGELVFTPNDNTDLTGAFAAIVAAGTYRVVIRPPATTMFTAVEMRGVVVAAAVDLGNLVLRPGVLLSGTVVDATSSAPLVNVDIDVSNTDGTRVFTLNDTTSATGTFSVIVPTGLFHVTFEAPRGSRYLGLERLNEEVTAAKNLGVIRMATGHLLSGRVVGPNLAAVVGADIDVDTAVGDVRIFTPYDETDANGNFTVVVPAGAFRVTVEPKKAALLVGARSAAVAVSGDTTMPQFTLSAGVLLSGTITAYDNSPEVGADLDVIDPTTGEEVITPGDDTDATGSYSIVVPNGTWRVRIQTGEVSLSRVEILNGVVVAGSTTLNRKLTLVPIGTFFGTLGVPTITNGGSVPAVFAFVNPTTQVQQTVARIVFIDPLGQETNMIGPLPLSVPVGFQFVTGLLMPTQQISPSLLGLTARLEARFDDPATGSEQDRSAFKFFVK